MADNVLGSGRQNEGPFILTQIYDRPIRNWEDVAKIIDDLAAQPRPRLTFILASKEGRIGVQRDLNDASSASAGMTIDTSRHRFPTLEEQKLADLAWKRLGLELEPIGEDDLKRVISLGYEGGVNIASTTDRVVGQPLKTDDLLVGLHVWPTTSLKDIVQVLQRHDIAELSPLKFYVVRLDGDPRYLKGQLPDKVVTGRISVNLDKSSAPTQRPPVQERAVRNTPHNAYEPIPIPPLSEQEKAKLRERGPLRLQFYYPPNSEPCRRAEERIAQYKAAFGDLLQIERINVEDQPELAVRQQIHVVPTMILLQGDRKKTQSSGAFTVSDLEEIITIIARGPSPPKQKQPSIWGDGETSSSENAATQLPRVIAATPMPIPLGSMKSSTNDAPANRQVDQALAADPNMAMMNQEMMQLQYQLAIQQTAMKRGARKKLTASKH